MRRNVLIPANQRVVMTPIPLTGKVFLVEESAVGAEERALDSLFVGDASTNVEHLATGFDIGIIT